MISAPCQPSSVFAFVPLFCLYFSGLLRNISVFKYFHYLPQCGFEQQKPFVWYCNNIITILLQCHYNMEELVTVEQLKPPTLNSQTRPGKTVSFIHFLRKPNINIWLSIYECWPNLRSRELQLMVLMSAVREAPPQKSVNLFGNCLNCFWLNPLTQTSALETIKSAM